jgi:mRNA-degrading endonuclease RelE of RelBE toxin-antitoxin system
MRAYKLTKQAFKTLTALAKNDPKTAKKLKEIIEKLRQDLISGESLQGYSQFKKIRAGKFRLIYTLQEEIVLVAIIEKRETVYQTFEHLFKHSDFLNTD